MTAPSPIEINFLMILSQGRNAPEVLETAEHDCDRSSVSCNAIWWTGSDACSCADPGHGATLGEGCDEVAIASARRPEDDEHITPRRIDPGDDGFRGVGDLADVAGGQVAEVKEGARQIAADNGLWHGESACPCRAGSDVPSNGSGFAEARTGPMFPHGLPSATPISHKDNRQRGAKLLGDRQLMDRLMSGSSCCRCVMHGLSYSEASNSRRCKSLGRFMSLPPSGFTAASLSGMVK